MRDYFTYVSLFTTYYGHYTTNCDIYYIYYGHYY